jgi:hypothetical protein
VPKAEERSLSKKQFFQSAVVITEIERIAFINSVFLPVNSLCEPYFADRRSFLALKRNSIYAVVKKGMK